MTLGECIRKLRNDNGMKQLELAALIGVSSPYLSKCEHGVITDIPLSEIEKMAAVFNLTAEDLLGMADPPEKSTAPVSKQEPACTLSKHDLWRLRFLSWGLIGMVLKCNDNRILSGLSFVSMELVNILSRVDPDPNERKEEQV